jgi:hypothetical protein
MLQINPFLDCTIYSGIIVHIGRNSHHSADFLFNDQFTGRFILIKEYGNLNSMFGYYDDLIKQTDLSSNWISFINLLNENTT